MKKEAYADSTCMAVGSRLKQMARRPPENPELVKDLKPVHLYTGTREAVKAIVTAHNFTRTFTGLEHFHAYPEIRRYENSISMMLRHMGMVQSDQGQSVTKQHL